MFDFSATPLRLSYLWPNTVAPVQAEWYGYCQCACFFCFANLNKKAGERTPNLVNSGPQLFRDLERAWQDERSPIGWHMRSGHFVCASNTTDPFQRAEKEYRLTETFLKWAQTHQVAVFVQTRGNVLFEEWERYAPLLDPARTCVYLSLSQMDDRLRRRLEPGALSIPDRFKLIKKLSAAGIAVVVACNPYVPAWVPDLDAYCRTVCDAGARHIYPYPLHLTPDQADQIPEVYRPEIARANPPLHFQRKMFFDWWEAAERHDLALCQESLFWDATFNYPGASVEDSWPAVCKGRTGLWQNDFFRTVQQRSDEAGRVPVVFNFTDLDGKCTIVDGNSRLDKLEKAGVLEVPCIVHADMAEGVDGWKDRRILFLMTYNRHQKIFDEDAVIARLRELAPRQSDLAKLGRLAGVDNIRQVVDHATQKAKESVAKATKAGPAGQCTSLVLYGPKEDVDAVKALLARVRSRLGPVFKMRTTLEQADAYQDLSDEQFLLAFGSACERMASLAE